MAINVAINGFGRIGRLVFRALVEQGHLGTKFNVVAVGDIVPADNLAYLLKYDSTQGRFAGTVSSRKSSPDKAEDDVLVVNGHEIKVVSAKTPAELPWGAMGVEVVIESTGLFTEAAKARGHLEAGAKKVIISAPAKDEDITVIIGVIRPSPVARFKCSQAASKTSSAVASWRASITSSDFQCSRPMQRTALRHASRPACSSETSAAAADLSSSAESTRSQRLA
jgi:glyceraldehyde-3-phosphate dehydrogenase type I